MADLTAEKTNSEATAENRKKIIKIVVTVAVVILAIWLAKKYVFKK